MQVTNKIITPLEDDITMEYCHITGRCITGSSPFHLPYIGDIVEETLRTLTLESHNRIVQEAVANRTYELYGMEKRNFVREALSGTLSGFAMKLPISAVVLQEEVADYLFNYFVSFTGYDEMIVNSPVKQVW